ncbi:DDE-domain-containing protein, partial [Didymella exigua CBS 183.55]
PQHTYNMDEKGLAIGLVNRSKRVFSKAAWEARGKRQSLQDGNREWVTILAAICADGSTLLPAIIYAGQPNSLQSSWMEDLDAGKDSIYSTATPSGWSNNEVGLAWLEQVFERETASKTHSSWRLLILDGHSSHITMAFIDYCSRHKILLLIYPPYSTQTLQPLDVGCFSPFGNNYSKEVTEQLHQSQALTGIKKPIILDRFQNKPSELPRTPSLLLDVNRVAIEQFCKAIVKDSTSYEARKLVHTFNYLAACNALLEAEEAAAKARKKAEAAEKKVQDEREKEQRKVERARAKEEKALRKAAEKAEKQRKKQESNAAKSIQLSQTGKRKASQKPPTEPLAKKQRARGATQVVVEASPSLTPPPITTRSGRTTRPNRKWEQDKHHRR